MDYMDEDLTDYKTNSSNYHGLFVYEFAHNGLCDPRHSPNYCTQKDPINPLKRVEGGED